MSLLGKALNLFAGCVAFFLCKSPSPYASVMGGEEHVIARSRENRHLDRAVHFFLNITTHPTFRKSPTRLGPKSSS